MSLSLSFSHSALVLTLWSTVSRSRFSRLLADFRIESANNVCVQATIGDKIVETLYLNRVTSENKRIRTPPLSPPFKVGVFVVFYR